MEEVWNIVTGSPRLKKLTEAAAAAYGDEKEYRRLKQSTLMKQVTTLLPT